MSIENELVESLKDFAGKLKRDEPLVVSHVNSRGKLVRRKAKPSDLKKLRVQDSMHDNVIDSLHRGVN
jgi:hypothetical protein